MTFFLLQSQSFFYDVEETNTSSSFSLLSPAFLPLSICLYVCPSVCLYSPLSLFLLPLHILYHHLVPFLFSVSFSPVSLCLFLSICVRLSVYLYFSLSYLLPLHKPHHNHLPWAEFEDEKESNERTPNIGY